MDADIKVLATKADRVADVKKEKTLKKEISNMPVDKEHPTNVEKVAKAKEELAKVQANIKVA